MIMNFPPTASVSVTLKTAGKWDECGIHEIPSIAAERVPAQWLI